MIDLTHIIDLTSIDFSSVIDFAAALPAQQPHPSDLGLIKPSSGFSLLPAIFGLIAIFQIFQFIYYGLPQNEPKEGWGLNSDSTLFSYRWKQFAGVQILVLIIGVSVMLAGPDLIFFPLGLK